MMTPATIHALESQNARRAARQNRVPLIIEAEDNVAEMLRGIPNLGSYRPAGWKLIHKHFVDSSGFGGPDEPAMTFDQFVGLVRGAEPGYGWAIISEGQFQVYIGQFEREKTR